MTPLFSEGLNLALYGMGTVFVFLTMLVYATTLMSWLVSRTEKSQSQDDIDPKKLAAITAAVHQYRNRRH